MVGVLAKKGYKGTFWGHRNVLCPAGGSYKGADIYKTSLNYLGCVHFPMCMLYLIKIKINKWKLNKMNMLD